MPSGAGSHGLLSSSNTGVNIGNASAQELGFYGGFHRLSATRELVRFGRHS
jgi:hypothetical protein